jgi:pimeloyl-ACP methyl ester carboxylesterase
MIDFNELNTQQAVSKDGTRITGRIYGNGSPVVLIPAGPGDCETTWRKMLPYLAEHHTCYLLNTRGRGLSEDHPDHSPARQVEDIVAFAETIGEPVMIGEWGSFVGASWSLIAAQKTEAISAIAAYDPLILEIATERDQQQLHHVFDQLEKNALEGRFSDAANNFVSNMASYGYYTDEDMAGEATIDFWMASAKNSPMFLNELKQAEEPGGINPADPSLLAKTTVPVLLLHGAQSHPMNIKFVNWLAGQIANPHICAIEGAGHYGPQTAPEAVVKEFIRFFAEIFERV